MIVFDTRFQLNSSINCLTFVFWLILMKPRGVWNTQREESLQEAQNRPSSFTGAVTDRERAFKRKFPPHFRNVGHVRITAGLHFKWSKKDKFTTFLYRKCDCVHLEHKSRSKLHSFLKFVCFSLFCPAEKNQTVLFFTVYLSLNQQVSVASSQKFHFPVVPTLFYRIIVKIWHMNRWLEQKEKI